MKNNTKHNKFCGVFAAAVAAVAINNSYGEDAQNITKKSSAVEHQDILIMKYSALPSRITLNAWTDDLYFENLLNNPNPSLYGLWGSGLRLDFLVHPNTDNIRNYCLPYPSEKILSMLPEEILATLYREIGDSASLDYFLPTPVIAKALIDENFRKLLLSNPNKVLLDMGYKIGDYVCVVHQDTENTRNLTLKKPLNNYLELRKLENRISIQSSCHGGCHNVGTTTCCATGTCD